MIGVIDSGFGGLSVLKGLLSDMPEYDYVYLGDSARAPYGSHSRETITRFSEEIVEFLFDRDVKLIIVACNTISGLALRHLQNKYIVDAGLKDKKNILGVIFPFSEEAATKTKNKRVGVVGTKGTISSRAYETEILKIDPEIEIFSMPCPLLVPFIEEGWHDKPEAKMVLKKYLRPMKSRHIDTLILGCTHYPLMMRDFKKYMGSKVHIVGDGSVLAKSLKDYLKRHPDIDKSLSRNGKRTYMTTDDPIKFKKMGEKFLGHPIPKIEMVNVEGGDGK
ncbi:glutamate racemase [Candidatus Peregrinibacteria bacterium CG22_combo_CG10-13_8_21_14_all_44_10]|nr:MAG: glutamate racemase [Candidatus Peregrinibacteria bacterium CG2_30_44_17]PIP66472.1 MAG: glutamate racemase [Candidatus Peregrinibacteria bacterium CG22_combo_CG10-13_8_21_14_all_44_10]PIX80162.1 MAG: glutamate racemase [Candidatus Peregrinibacteria bacterium CG_4_10_14_3_um_filter_44_21]PJB89510.1 MAG: glutamate racemase [Candidatus Peregrinibacteria bacterium CG_4_9_14_0_8_um_filter_44_15]